MYQSLNSNYDILAKYNHKGLTIYYFNHFLNKSATITAKECGTNDIFVPDITATGYVQNSVLIDGTNILRSVPAIDQEHHFLININLNAFPKLTHNNVQSILEHLKFTDSSRKFSKSILKIIIEDR